MENINPIAHSAESNEQLQKVVLDYNLNGFLDSVIINGETFDYNNFDNLTSDVKDILQNYHFVGDAFKDGVGDKENYEVYMDSEKFSEEDWKKIPRTTRGVKPTIEKKEEVDKIVLDYNSSGFLFSIEIGGQHFSYDSENLTARAKEVLQNHHYIQSLLELSSEERGKFAIHAAGKEVESITHFLVDNSR